MGLVLEIWLQVLSPNGWDPELAPHPIERVRPAVDVQLLEHVVDVVLHRWKGDPEAMAIVWYRLGSKTVNRVWTQTLGFSTCARPLVMPVAVGLHYRTRSASCLARSG